MCDNTQLFLMHITGRVISSSSCDVLSSFLIIKFPDISLILFLVDGSRIANLVRCVPNGKRLIDFVLFG